MSLEDHRPMMVSSISASSSASSSTRHTNKEVKKRRNVGSQLAFCADHHDVIKKLNDNSSPVVAEVE
jgi:hypothetical protein